MAAYGFTVARGDIQVGGFSSWKVNRSGDTGYVSLGPLADGRLVASLQTAPNSQGQQKPYGVKVEASAKMLGTDKSTVLLLLDHLVDKQLTSKITSIAGPTYKGDWGFRWRFDSSSDYQGYRYVEVMADHSFVIDHASYQDWTEFLNTPAADGSLNGELATFSAATMVPAGFAAFEIRNAGETDWETLGGFRNGRLVCECLTTLDSQARSNVYGVRVSCEAEMLQASATELAFLDNVATTTLASGPDFRVTLADGTLVTLADNTGVSWEYHNDTDAEGNTFIRMAGGGIFTLTGFIALVS